MLYFQSLLYISKIICIKLPISWHPDNPLASHFAIEKTRKLVIQKYYWPTFCHYIKAYIKGCNICLASKSVVDKLYGDLQSLLMFAYCWKDILMDFIIELLISTNQKGNSYDIILVIVDQLPKMVHYQPVKITISVSDLMEVILNMIVQHYVLPNLIVSDYVMS